MEKLTIHLAGQPYEIQELTLGQLEDMQDAILKPAAAGAFSKSTNREVLAIALREDHPSLTLDALGKLRLGSIKKLDETVRSVLQFAGFRTDAEKPAERPSGEAVAG